ncbi:MotA/TolQ/ExbB proton channel family protein [Hahella sp. SMD15-11]|uniref:MotA/TolQ/ExbB proton channel family protein n=1 Tax=Thermohahella caldifontis TaxID=3142973 RepID=A0AB39UU06_9GAMM
MDVLTWLGLLSAVGVVTAAILSGSGLDTFVNLPGLGIVVFGTLAVTLVKFRAANLGSSIRLAFRTAFVDRQPDPRALVEELQALANVVRKDGMIGIDRMTFRQPLVERAALLAADGHPPEFVEEVLADELDQTLQRLQTAESVFRGMGDSAPALGMLGTLVGLVQMLNNMEDPSSIGPAMAVALLTTFYGAFIAQLIALPLADKLRLKAEDEVRSRMIVFRAMQSILRGQNPRVMLDVLKSWVPDLTLAKPAAAGSEAGRTEPSL